MLTFAMASDAESLISRVSEHFFTEEFQGNASRVLRASVRLIVLLRPDAIDAFISKNASTFIDVTDANTEEGEDHKLE